MKAFDWSKLDLEFLKAVAYSGKTDDAIRPRTQVDEPEFLIPAILNICPRPDVRFIRDYRAEIEDHLLPLHEDAVHEVGKYMHIDGRNDRSTINELSKLKLSDSLITAYGRVLYSLAGEVEVSIENELRYLNRVIVDVKALAAADIKLYDYQKDAVAALTRHFVEEDRASGLLVMPTGSGKTRTAVYFLLREMVSRGYQVIWLAHRYMLLDQAADNFFNHAGLIKLRSGSIAKKYRLLCVSGAHRALVAAEKDDTVLVANVPSVCRSLPHLKRILQKNVIIVVDEAHHALADSYQNTIEAIRKSRPNAKLLGLTATPVRMTDAGSVTLRKIFDDTVVFEKSLAELIALGVLAEPVVDDPVSTGANFETGLSDKERADIRRNHDLPESAVNRIAQHKARNAVIVETYLKKRAEYGKTLIFALNVVHCQLLTRELQRRGVRCDCVYAGREDNAAVIQKFHSGDLEALVNVNIMTEGSDVPDIETVMLTRPTQSEGFLMQMIGRGMRGPQAGGTPKLNIVDFHDQWQTFNRWLNPKWLFQPEAPYTPPEPREVKHAPRDGVPMEIIEQVYDAIAEKAVNVDILTALPILWFSVLDEEGNDLPLLVYEDQLEGYERMIQDREALSDGGIDPKALLKKYFGGFGLIPAARDVLLFAEALRNLEGPPPRYMLEDRREIDPVTVGARVMWENLDARAVAQELYTKYEVVQKLYGSLKEYALKIVEYSYEDSDRITYGVRVPELEAERIPHRMEPVYDLMALTKEVIGEMFGGKCGMPDISWTDRPYRGYFGVCYSDGLIRVNRVLNSPDVPREVVKLVVYHEMLHLSIHGHGTEFRRREALYPAYHELSAFLYSMGEKMDIQGW